LSRWVIFPMLVGSMFPRQTCGPAGTARVFCLFAKSPVDGIFRWPRIEDGVMHLPFVMLWLTVASEAPPTAMTHTAVFVLLTLRLHGLLASCYLPARRNGGHCGDVLNVPLDVSFTSD
jgi:hypothetical protein